MTEYNRQDLDRDLHTLVKIGLLDVHIREDGEWVFAISDEAKNLTEEQILQKLEQLEADEEQ